MKEEVQDDREIQPHDSEDSLNQERVADELRRLTETQAPTTRDAPYQSSEEGATAPIPEEATPPPLGIGKEPQLQTPRGIGKVVVPMHLRDQEDTGVDYSLRIHTCLVLLFG